MGPNFNLKINSSGYTWPLTYNAALPAKETVSHGIGINGSFDATDFNENSTGVDYSQIWRPSTQPNFPIYYGQIMTDPDDQFKLMFIDLKVGNLGTNVNQTYNMTLTDRGATRVDYTVEDLYGAKLAFNSYGWCNWSNQQQGVSWTNSLTQSPQSGWSINT